MKLVPPVTITRVVGPSNRTLHGRRDPGEDRRADR